MYMYKILVIFETGTHYETEQQADTSDNAIIKVLTRLQNDYVSGLNEIISVTVTDVKELK